MKVGAMRRRLKHVRVVGGRTDAFDESVPDGPHDDWKCSLTERCPVPLDHILTRPYIDGDITSCMLRICACCVAPIVAACGDNNVWLCDETELHWYMPMSGRLSASHSIIDVICSYVKLSCAGACCPLPSSPPRHIAIIVKLAEQWRHPLFPSSSAMWLHFQLNGSCQSTQSDLELSCVRLSAWQRHWRHKPLRVVPQQTYNKPTHVVSWPTHAWRLIVVCVYCVVSTSWAALFYYLLYLTTV